MMGGAQFLMTRTILASHERRREESVDEQKLCKCAEHLDTKQDLVKVIYSSFLLLQGV
jgi:hypothetical protein